MSKNIRGATQFTVFVLCGMASFACASATGGSTPAASGAWDGSGTTTESRDGGANDAGPSAPRGASGAIDTTFGQSGFALAMDGVPEITAILALADGKTLVAGPHVAADGVFDGVATIRFDASGTPDTGYGHGGLSVAQAMIRPDHLAIAPDGSLFVGGYVSPDHATYALAVAHLAADGSLDTSFGQAGVASVSAAGSAYSRATVALTSNGTITVGGSGTLGFVAARFRSNGALDPTFSGGTASDRLSHDDRVFSMVARPDGSIVLAGDTYTTDLGDTTELALVGFRADGSLNPAFGAGGVVHTAYAGPNPDLLHTSRTVGMASAADGSLLVGTGWTATIVSDGGHMGDSVGLELYRIDASGKVDSSYGKAGVAITPASDDYESYAALALQSDGKVIVLGATPDGTGGNGYLLARFDSNGSIDNSFGHSGRVVTTFPSATDSSPRAIAIAADGRILVAGSYSGNGTQRLALARFWP